MEIEIFMKLERGLWQTHISVNGEWRGSFMDVPTLAVLQDRIAAELAKMGLR